MSTQGHSSAQNQKAQLASAYNELGKELMSSKLRVIGNYTLGRTIGEGSYGKVLMGTHRLTSTRVAIKQIPKSMSSSLTREIHHHRALHHPHIVQLYEIIASESYIYLVTELCSGGELFDYLLEQPPSPDAPPAYAGPCLSEEKGRVIVGQLGLAVGYCHDKGIVHRDLKLENVLLDERCRVKLSDFGFTREWEKGVFLETWCGTTGYAAPEMIKGERYLGPEVDIWSLGVILYTLLTGTLPFDDDDEEVMRQKIMIGEYEDPVWLSNDARDLIKNILQQDPAKRLNMSQILSHAWFTSGQTRTTTSSAVEAPTTTASRPRSSSNAVRAPKTLSVNTVANATSLSASVSSSTSASTSANSDASFLSASSEPWPSTPTTPESASSPAQLSQESKIADSPTDLRVAQAANGADLGKDPVIHRNASQATIKRPAVPPSDSDDPFLSSEPTSASLADTTFSSQGSPSPDIRPNMTRQTSRGTTNSTTRTPARTKRRSVASNVSVLSASDEEQEKAVDEMPLSPIPDTRPGPQDFSALLSTPAPVIFSTVLERDLLNNMSALGLDTAQMVHSVLSDACDAAGAVFWMLKRKAEKRAVERGEGSKLGALTDVPVRTEHRKSKSHAVPNGNGEEKNDERRRDKERDKEKDKEHEKEKEKEKEKRGPPEAVKISGLPVNLDEHPALVQARSAPNLHFVPATPTVDSNRPATPTRSGSPTRPLLTPSGSVVSHASSSTPGAGSSKDKDSAKRRDSKSRNRSGSVSIMQRATTALEAAAAGLVRKKSAEAVKEKAKEQEREREKEKEKEKEHDKAAHSLEDARSSHGSGRLTKSPPLRAIRDAILPSTPSMDSDVGRQGSPWVLASAEKSGIIAGGSPPHSRAGTPTASPGDTLTSLPNVGDKAPGSHRNRASLLSAFRMWFDADRKAKRKSAAMATAASTREQYQRSVSTPAMGPSASGRGSMKRRTSGSGPGTAARRPKGRKSGGSRRSSSVNSRRSSITSMQVLVDPNSTYTIEQMAIVSRQRSDNSRRSFGSHTPNSERGEYSSRPSSVHSIQMPRHRKSPSISSAGSGKHYGRTSPMSSHYHRRVGSGSSTRVVRKVQQSPATRSVRPSHGRSDSAASMHSVSSSRHGSMYDLSESEPQRTASPYRRRNSNEEPASRKPVAFAAQKRTTPFMSPAATLGRSSWKKSWGMEPPGWQHRSTHVPIEVLSISPVADAPASIRDVFSGRASMSAAGDEDEWVDEDEDIPAFAGGLGQMPTSAIGSASGSTGMPIIGEPQLPARSGRTSRPTKRSTSRSGGYGASSGTGGGSRSKTGQSPAARTSPLPTDVFDTGDMRGTRRQLPVGRANQAFRANPIQEEDEDGEE